MTENGGEALFGAQGEVVLRTAPFSPVLPDQTTAAVLEATFGRRNGGKLHEPAWLLWVGAGRHADQHLPKQFDEPVSPQFILAGPVDAVEPMMTPELYKPDHEDVSVLPVPRRRWGPAPDTRLRLETATSESTLVAVHRAATQPVARAPGLTRYLEVVADRYDEDGYRVERFAAARCRLSDTEVGIESLAGELQPIGALRWWRATPQRGPGLTADAGAGDAR